jgi:hypothetical protein
MKTKILVLALLIVPVCFAQGDKKLYVHTESVAEGNMVVYIEDLETGTRCYAITNSRLNASGYAISCVPKR